MWFWRSVGQPGLKTYPHTHNEQLFLSLSMVVSVACPTPRRTPDPFPIHCRVCRSVPPHSEHLSLSPFSAVSAGLFHPKTNTCPFPHSMLCLQVCSIPRRTPVPFPPKGGRGCLMSPPCLESQGCHLIPLCYLLSCSSA